ncbi:MAG: uroporphyrinogen-III synthase, partial [Deltaproteobacteria bacterium]|nr:uroporphyrinogen-III synthase [Deltaproteobacteria bacterium]
NKIAAIGPATADELRQRGIEPDFVPPKYVAESIVDGLLARGAAGARILIPRAAKAREVLPDELARAGSRVHVLPVYETVLAEGELETLREWLADGRVHCVTFTSSSTVENFFALMPPDELAPYRDTIRLACIGPVTAETLRSFGLEADIMPDEYTIPALARALNGRI